MNEKINPVGLKGYQVTERMKELMGIKTINENKKTSVVELTKKGPDGNVYGIVRENHEYYIKITKKQNNLVVEDFQYIGGLQNKKQEVYPSYAKAIKHLNLKFHSLNEAYGKSGQVNVFLDDKLLTEDYAAFESMGSGFKAEGNMEGHMMSECCGAQTMEGMCLECGGSAYGGGMNEFDKPAMNSFKDQYGDEEGEKNYYATANAQDRDAETFEKNEGVDEGLFSGDKYKKIDIVKYNGFEFDVWDNGKEKVIGHPRKENTEPQYMPEFLVYRYSDLNNLKKSIDSMGNEQSGKKSGMSDWQSGDSGMDAGAGTAVPSIFPRPLKKIKNPNFKGYSVDEELDNEGLTPEMAAVHGMMEKEFPDLTGDGKVTRADILKGRGVELDNESEDLMPEMAAVHGMMKVEDEMTDKEKQFAALAEPKDEITYADKIAGATKKEGKLSIERVMGMMDEMIDELQESRSKKKI